MRPPNGTCRSRTDGDGPLRTGKKGPARGMQRTRTRTRVGMNLGRSPVLRGPGWWLWARRQPVLGIGQGRRQRGGTRRDHGVDLAGPCVIPSGSGWALRLGERGPMPISPGGPLGGMKGRPRQNGPGGPLRPQARALNPTESDRCPSLLRVRLALSRSRSG
jgi:hypothetical protein